MKNNKLTKIAILVTLCLILSYVEVLIPFNFVIPGVKLGLSNIVIVYALYAFDLKTAFSINIIRIVLSALLFTNPITMLYSISGGVLSFIAMVLIKQVKCLSLISVSVTGGIFHNVGQILMAMVVLSSAKIIYYLPVLMFCGILTGILTGYIGAVVTRRLSKI